MGASRGHAGRAGRPGRGRGGDARPAGHSLTQGPPVEAQPAPPVSHTPSHLSWEAWEHVLSVRSRNSTLSPTRAASPLGLGVVWLTCNSHVVTPAL